MTIYYDHCQDCGKELTEDVDYIDDYGVIICQECLDKNPKAQRYLNDSFRNDPIEDNYR